MSVSSWVCLNPQLPDRLLEYKPFFLWTNDIVLRLTICIHLERLLTLNLLQNDVNNLMTNNSKVWMWTCDKWMWQNPYLYIVQ